MARRVDNVDKLTREELECAILYTVLGGGESTQQVSELRVFYSLLSTESLREKAKNIKGGLWQDEKPLTTNAKRLEARIERQQHERIVASKNTGIYRKIKPTYQRSKQELLIAELQILSFVKDVSAIDNEYVGVKLIDKKYRSRIEKIARQVCYDGGIIYG